MTQPVGWARLWATVRPPHSRELRSGAWYPIVEGKAIDRVTVEGPLGPVAVPRTILEVRRERPRRFTVVYRAISDANPVRGTTADLGRSYAVCPYSKTRIRLVGRPDTLKCPTCGHIGTVAWWETG